MDGPLAWGMGKVLTTPHSKNWHSHETYTRTSDLNVYDLNIRDQVPNNIAWNLISHFYTKLTSCEWCKRVK